MKFREDLDWPNPPAAPSQCPPGLASSSSEWPLRRKFTELQQPQAPMSSGDSCVAHCPLMNSLVRGNQTSTSRTRASPPHHAAEVGQVRTFTPSYHLCITEPGVYDTPNSTLQKLKNPKFIGSKTLKTYLTSFALQSL